MPPKTFCFFFLIQLSLGKQGNLESEKSSLNICFLSFHVESFKRDNISEKMATWAVSFQYFPEEQPAIPCKQKGGISICRASGYETGGLNKQPTNFSGFLQLCYRTTRAGGGLGWTIYYHQKDPPFLSGGPPHLLGLPCPPPEERLLSMPETGEKERNYLFKSYTDLE